jgi:signal peptidase I
MTKAILGAFVAAIIIKLFLFDFIVAEGNSMEPAIHNGSVLIINRVQYGLRFPWQQGYLIRWAAPKQGDLVVFYSPLGDIAVKRCDAITGNGNFIAHGDNSLQSYDSRSYGPISIDATIGKVLGKK